MFLKNLVAFVLGLACQVLALVFPSVCGPLSGVGGLLLSAANFSLVLDGNFWRHVAVFMLGAACTVASALIVDARGPLQVAGALLFSQADLARVASFLRPTPPVAAPGEAAKPPEVKS